jgi:hypothetical protein
VVVRFEKAEEKAGIGSPFLPQPNPIIDRDKSNMIKKLYFILYLDRFDNFLKVVKSLKD